MNNNLARALLDRGVINNKTRILAKCPMMAFGGMHRRTTKPNC